MVCGEDGEWAFGGLLVSGELLPWVEAVVNSRLSVELSRRLSFFFDDSLGSIDCFFDFLLAHAFFFCVSFY